MDVFSFPKCQQAIPASPNSFTTASRVSIVSLVGIVQRNSAPSKSIENKLLKCTSFSKNPIEQYKNVSAFIHQPVIAFNETVIIFSEIIPVWIYFVK
eukprot:Awhi_evm1s13213